MRSVLIVLISLVAPLALAQEPAAPAREPARDLAQAIEDLEPAVDVSNAGGPVPRQTRAASAPRATLRPTEGVIDTLDLGTTSITGNQELPKVLYIVPWKRSDLGDLVGRPVNTLLDEVLAPIDPEVFERHLDYYDSLYGDSLYGDSLYGDSLYGEPLDGDTENGESEQE